ncbi:MAG: S8 family serine peptidase [Bdellovibrionales bacterium]
MELPSQTLLKTRIVINAGEEGIDINGNEKATNGLDDDGNGFVDDYQGYNFATNTPQNVDNSGHGTHVAGIVAADHDKITYITNLPQGIAPRAKILPLDFIDTDGGTLDDAIRAIDYVIMMNEQMNIRVVNASWGGPSCSSILEEKISQLGLHNILFISAAGNLGRNLENPNYFEYPAKFKLANQITVGSTTFFGGMAGHSNYGELSVDLFAPGEDIFSTLFEDSVGMLTGTSMAAPFVAGAAAVLWSAKPTANYNEIKQAINAGVDYDPFMISITRGSLNIQCALEHLLNQPLSQRCQN